MDTESRDEFREEAKAYHLSPSSKTVTVKLSPEAEAIWTEAETALRQEGGEDQDIEVVLSAALLIGLKYLQKNCLT